MKTYYIENTSGALRNTLLIRKWIHENRAVVQSVGAMDVHPGAIWFTCEKETADELIDYLSTMTSDHIEVYDDAGKTVSSTHPVEDRGNPKISGPYLCLVAYQQSLGKSTEWRIVGWGHDRDIGDCWTNPGGQIVRWLHLPRK